jgi:hypothetical protein
MSTRTPSKAAFCEGAPAPTVVRAKLRVERAGHVRVDIDRVYGPPAPTSAIAQRFADLEDDETLLVSLAPSGAVVGSGWPVFEDKVSLQGSIPDMSEGEAAALLMSPQCRESLTALRDQGTHPAAASPSYSSHGCACEVHAAPDAGTAALVVATSIVVAVLRGSAPPRAPRAGPPRLSAVTSPRASPAANPRAARAGKRATE